MSEPSPAPSLTVLADRDVDTRAMYAQYLRLAQFVVEEAGDGREALAKALALKPESVVTDARLPGISGLDLCRLLRNDLLTRTISIVVVTANAEASEIRRVQEAGADAVLIKPCLPDALLAEMQSTIERARGLESRPAVACQQSLEQPASSVSGIERSPKHRLTLAKSHYRCETSTPPLSPPALMCPACNARLVYRSSHVGGVSARNSEQWDYYACHAGCGEFQYRQRTRRVRRV